MLDPLELELQASVSHLICVLRTKLESSARVLSALNYRAISSALKIFSQYIALL